MPSAAMEIILLERVDNLGDMGEVVRVRPGYARNFLLPQKKALRATGDNLAYYETQRASLEKHNADKRKQAEKQARNMEGLTVALIRHAADSGQLFGSVNARDIADAISAKEKDLGILRSQIQLNQSIKTVGLFHVPVALHPEVRVLVTVNVARTEEESKIQAKTGQALVSGAIREEEADLDEATEKVKHELLEESVLEAEKAEQAEAEEVESVGDDETA